MDFSFPPLKLPNKGMEEYYKIILFIHFHSIPFHSLFPNETLVYNNRVSFNFVDM